MTFEEIICRLQSLDINFVDLLRYNEGISRNDFQRLLEFWKELSDFENVLAAYMRLMNSSSLNANENSVENLCK